MISKTNVSVNVLNRIRESASVYYKEAVPICTPNADNIRDIGAILIDSPNLQNEFLNSLINRIGKIVIKSRLFNSPLKPFVKGELQYGELIEEVFINIVSAHQYNAEASENTVWKREHPDVKSQFHPLNSELYYKISTGRKELEKAFLGGEGVADMVSAITERLFVSAEYDRFLLMKYQIAKAMLDGSVTMYPVSKVTDEATARTLMKGIKEVSNNFEILSTDYNTAGVYNSSAKEDQYLIISNKNDSNLSVDCLSYMFGVEYSNSGAKKIRIDGFDKFDMTRLNKLLNITEGNALSDTEVLALSNVEAVLLDWSWFQVYYKLFETRYLENPENLYENTWLHVWTIYSRSIFENCVAFVSGTNGISSIALGDTPTVTHGVSGSAEINATITFTGLTPKNGGVIVWSVATSQGATGEASIDQNGVLTWDDDFTATDTITVTATSFVDSTVTASKTITVA